MKLTAKELAAFAGGRLIYGNGDAEVSSITLNSAEIKAGDLFVPIVGQRVDAHRFLASAFEKGAAAAFSSRHKDAEALKQEGTLWEALSKKERETAVIFVEDTKEALQKLGKSYRRKLVSIPVAAVTGSVGKTTTREMIATALASEKRVFATKKNANSQVGVPITLTEIGADAELAVLELGMSEFGEMSRISEIAGADAAVITNIGVSHIENLKTQENILKEKLHILDGMPEGASLFLNGDDPLLRALDEEKIHGFGIFEGKHVNLFFYGLSEGTDVQAKNLSDQKDGMAFTVRFSERILKQFAGKGESREALCCRLSMTGTHMVQNALSALSVALWAGVSPEKAAEALFSFSGVSGRGEKTEYGEITVIDSSYNAAPASMKAELEQLFHLKAEGRRIAVLADMLELGEHTLSCHEEVLSYIEAHREKLHALYLYGPVFGSLSKAFREAVPTLPIESFAEKKDLSEALKKTLQKGDAVLFKGSNGMGLSEVVRELFPG